jgi:hypothetical protein
MQAGSELSEGLGVLGLPPRDHEPDSNWDFRPIVDVNSVNEARFVKLESGFPSYGVQHGSEGHEVSRAFDTKCLEALCGYVGRFKAPRLVTSSKNGFGVLTR